MIAALALVTMATAPVVEVVSDRGVYSVRVEAFVPAPRADVWALLTDYPNLGRLGESIRESEVIEVRDDGATVLDTTTHSCQGPFCRTLRHRQVLTEHPQTRIAAVTVDTHSDFRDGFAEWTLRDADGGTHLTYAMTIRPTVFVPPFVGPPFVRRALTREVQDIIAGIQHAAEASQR